jgi:hypothetical protein
MQQSLSPEEIIRAKIKSVTQHVVVFFVFITL